MADAKFFNKEKVLARFAAMPAIVQQTAEASLKEQVDELVGALKRATPVAPELEKRPGQLRDSIVATPTKGRIYSFRIVAWARDSKNRLFGSYVEFGHTAAGGRHVPARPFWYSTYRAWKKPGLAKIRADVRAAIKANFPPVTGS